MLHHDVGVFDRPPPNGHIHLTLAQARRAVVLNGRMGRSAGLQGLALATLAGAVVALPAGTATAGASLFRPPILAAGLVVGVLSAALPYTLDLVALRRLPTPIFGVLTSLNPAAAAVAGAVILHDRLAPPALAGIAAVMLASAGAVISRSAPSRQPARQPSLIPRDPQGPTGPAQLGLEPRNHR